MSKDHKHTWDMRTIQKEYACIECGEVKTREEVLEAIGVTTNGKRLLDSLFEKVRDFGGLND